MINLIIEVLEYPIRHTLEVNEIHLSANTESICDNVLYPGCQLPTAQNLDTVWTNIREHLTHLSSDVTMPIPCTGEKGITLTVIFLVDLQKVSKKPLKIGRLLEFIQSHRQYVLVGNSNFWFQFLGPPS
jgi:hypothetical protein